MEAWNDHWRDDYRWQWLVQPSAEMTKYVKWPCDWNRPLSKEELAIARRLDRAPKVDEFGPVEIDPEPSPPRMYFDVEIA
jgi:hypothetical protein